MSRPAPSDSRDGHGRSGEATKIVPSPSRGSIRYSLGDFFVFERRHSPSGDELKLISERTKEGLAAAKAKGKLLGRPKGALGTSRLDGKEQDIRALLGKDVSKASIAKILDVSRSALYHFIQTRKIAPG